MQVVNMQTELQELAWGLQATDAPALYSVWLGDLEIRDVLNEIRSAAASASEIIAPNGAPPLERLEARAAAPDSPQAFILQCCLSSLDPCARREVNAERGWLLNLNRKLIFVEPAAQERQLRRDFPDIFCVARDSFHLSPPVFEDDYQWDNSPIGRLDTLAKTLPPIVTRGSIIVERGTPHFKGPPLAECPRCKTTKLSRGTATLTFKQAPPATQLQQVEAWICSCGEFYVPGEIAKEAYHRAFQSTPELPKGEREYRAFLRLLPGLLATHRGKYVAIHNEQVVDSDTDDVALILRVQKKIGYVPIYVGLVTDARPVIRGPRYREIRPQGNS